MDLDVEKYLKADRQWPRVLRLAHARMQFKQSTDPAEKHFWRDVIEANELKVW